MAGTRGDVFEDGHLASTATMCTYVLKIFFMAIVAGGISPTTSFEVGVIFAFAVKLPNRCGSETTLNFERTAVSVYLVQRNRL